MREMKFRAWDKKEKRWFSPTIDSSGVAITEERHEEGCPSCGGTIRGTHTIEYPNDYELMQYTGLKDKNEKEIYEGDIISYYHPVAGKRNAEIFWCEEKLKFCKRIVGRKKYSGLRSPSRLNPQAEIIGNIYENPELLNN